MAYWNAKCIYILETNNEDAYCSKKLILNVHSFATFTLSTCKEEESWESMQGTESLEFLHAWTMQVPLNLHFLLSFVVIWKSKKPLKYGLLR